MPPRSKITGLPDDVKAALNQWLIQKDFSDYDGLASFLTEKGYEISRSSLGRYGQNYERRLASIKIATEQARAIAEACPDDEGAMTEALIRLVQTQSYNYMIDLQTDDPKEFSKNFPKVGLMIAKMAEASVKQKKYAAEARRQAFADAADVVETVARQQGLSEAQARFWREKVLMGA